MDDETRSYLDAMESRLMARMNHLESMESRLMARMNDNQETLLVRLRANEIAIRGNETAISVLTEVARGTNNTLASITALLSTIASAQSDLGRRVTDLEQRKH